ncbi:MAG TPA: hypothetical protein VFA04_05130 [Bryobacteraceae bacterium]|nr:hypothetical protein [Bryobacteraceae bacterium]
MALRMPDSPEIPPEQLAAIEPIVRETLTAFRRAASEMPPDTPMAVEYRADDHR